MDRDCCFRTSPKIAPYGCRTTSWEWRDKLKVEDRVDTFDTRGNWFLSTVLDTREDKPGVRSLYVGFRVYLEDGTKMDLKNRKYEGWTEQHDEWIPAYSIRIQK